MVYFLMGMDFPDVEESEEDGLLAFGGDLSVERLLLAYNRGIFPWYDDESPILWWSPPKRMVLFPDELRVSKSMRKLFRDNFFEVTYNSNFERVIRACSEKEREGQDGTWINEDIIGAYCELNRRGYAMSVEVWKGGEIVGGLYGVIMGKVFCGESMFSNVSNSSKYGFISFVRDFRQFELIDCQVYSQHLESMGAREIDRKEFLKYLK